MPDQIETMRHCLGLIASQQEAAAGSMQVLYKLLGNLAAAPQVRPYEVAAVLATQHVADAAIYCHLALAKAGVPWQTASSNFRRGGCRKTLIVLSLSTVLIGVADGHLLATGDVGDMSDAFV
jgi:hypothetical protein